MSTFCLKIKEHFGAKMQMNESLCLLLLNSDNMGMGFANERGVFRTLQNVYGGACCENS